ncbi:methylthioribulose 1-phosphate dehydratase [Paenibacillus puldeungensis]|uniref:Methylthioribulose-1-phosphate dehydratase n=1 Tax=Paenibacillus puldeungensis TaxID=696536 RepID=A0ABW3S3I8_9BACL
MTFADIRWEEKQTALAELRAMNDQLAKLGWFPGSSGNLSVRVGSFTPNEFYFAVNSRVKDRSPISAESYLFVDAAGNPCEATDLEPCSETPVHAKIYRMTGCGAVYHVHTVFNHVLSDYYSDEGYVAVQGNELTRDFCTGIVGESEQLRIPILPNSVDISSITKQIPGALNLDVPCFLMRNHGIYVWGKTALETKHRLEAFEFIFEVLYRSLLLPPKR